MRWRLILPSVVLYCVTACYGALPPRECSTNADCIRGGDEGYCLPDPDPSSSAKWCAFDVDVTECPSGREWGARAAEDLAGTCVGASVDDGGPVDGAVDAGATDAG